MEKVLVYVHSVGTGGVGEVGELVQAQDHGLDAEAAEMHLEDVHSLQRRLGEL